MFGTWNFEKSLPLKKLHENGTCGVEVNDDVGVEANDDVGVAANDDAGAEANNDGGAEANEDGGVERITMLVLRLSSFAVIVLE